MSNPTGNFWDTRFARCGKFWLNPYIKFIDYRDLKTLNVASSWDAIIWWPHLLFTNRDITVHANGLCQI